MNWAKKPLANFNVTKPSSDREIKAYTIKWGSFQAIKAVWKHPSHIVLVFFYIPEYLNVMLTCWAYCLLLWWHHTIGWNPHLLLCWTGIQQTLRMCWWAGLGRRWRLSYKNGREIFYKSHCLHTPAILNMYYFFLLWNTKEVISQNVELLFSIKWQRTVIHISKKKKETKSSSTTYNLSSKCSEDIKTALYVEKTSQKISFMLICHD